MTTTTTMTMTATTATATTGTTMLLLRGLLLSMLFAAACGDGATAAPDAATAAPDAAPVAPDAAALRDLLVEAALDGNGLSTEVAFVVPSRTRSLTIVAEGDEAALLALGSLVLADGTDRVDLDLNRSWAAEMTASYHDEQIGQMPGSLYQSIRLGTFTQVYPNAPGQALPAGPASLRIASTATNGNVTVRLLLPDEDEARTLAVNLVAVSDQFSFSGRPPFVDVMQTIFDQAGIAVVVRESSVLADSGLERISTFSEPQEAPDSQAAELAGLGPQNGALNIFVVEGLPSGVGGLSLGTPGPPVQDSSYFGVLLLHSTSDALLGRVMAHEVAHFLALQHVTNRGISGMSYADPLADTEPGQGNLMENGTTLTPDQAYALSRSALLTLP